MDKAQGIPFWDKIKLYLLLLVTISSVAAIKYNAYLKSDLILNGKENQILGWILVGIFIYLTIYSFKKRRLIMFLGKLSFWYSLHIYAGIIGMVVLLVHSGFSLSSGLSMVIAVVMVFIFLNGVYGLVMHFLIPEVVLGQKVEFLNLFEINEKWEELGNKFRQLTKGKSEQFKKKFAVIANKYAHGNINIVYFFRSNFFKNENLSEHIISLGEKENAIPEEERADYSKLLDYFAKRCELSRQIYLIGLMNNWVNYHISAIVVLVLLVALHIFSFYYY